MDASNNRTRRTNGAFRPITGCYSSDYPKSLPPERFVASCVAGGVKDFFLKLSKSKENAQTQEDKNKNGILQSNPVPNLAGRYRVLQLIGQGQSSILVAAEDLYHPSKQMVAIKIMNLDYKALGAQEADCIQQLNRADPLKVSRIVRLLNKFMYDNHYCMTFELLRPKPLHQYFQRTEVDSEEEILERVREVTTQILGVLGFLRRENVIHADLKPENILLESSEKMRIKVVDFGNAIRWVHQEMSLYYDNFELQTLLYRAPEVMFGVPFGPEIDMWSLGCILAELYLGEPLFMGQNKLGVLQEMVSILGPFPRIPFQSGKFYSEFAGFISSKPGPSVPSLEGRLMKKLHNMKNFTFANFLTGLLQYNPNNRLTPIQAASHPFLACHVPFAEFLTPEDDLRGRSETRRSGILLSPSQYTYQPIIDDDIRRQHLSSLDLLHYGTRSKDLIEPKRTRTPPVGRVVPRVNYGRSKSCDKEDTKPPVNQGMSGRHASKNEVAHGRVPQTCCRNLTSSSLMIEERALPIASNVLEYKNDRLVLEPAGYARMTDENKIVLDNKAKDVAALDIPFASLEERRDQKSSDKLIDRKTQRQITTGFDDQQCQSSDAFKDKKYQWLEGGLPNNTSVNAVSLVSQKQTQETSEAARTRLYDRSKKPKTKKNSLLQNHDSITKTNKGSALSKDTLSQKSSSPKSNLPECCSEVETSSMSYAKYDSSDDDSVEEFFLRHTNKTRKRSISFRKSDKNNGHIVTEYQSLRKTKAANKRTTPIFDVRKISNSAKRTVLLDASPSLTDDFSSENEITESKTHGESTSKKNVKLCELKKTTEQRTTRLKTKDDNNERPSTPKRARRSLKLLYPHEDDDVNLL